MSDSTEQNFITRYLDPPQSSAENGGDQDSIVVDELTRPHIPVTRPSTTAAHGDPQATAAPGPQSPHQLEKDGEHRATSPEESTTGAADEPTTIANVGTPPAESENLAVVPHNTPPPPPQSAAPPAVRTPPPGNTANAGGRSPGDGYGAQGARPSGLGNSAPRPPMPLAPPAGYPNSTVPPSNYAHPAPPPGRFAPTGPRPAFPAPPPAGYPNPAPTLGYGHPAPPAGGYANPAPPPPDRPTAAPHGGLSAGELRVQVRQTDLVRPYKPAPETGWRRGLHRATRINLGPGPAEREWIDLKRRLAANLRGTYLIAVVGEKGGTAKTTATLGLGAALKRYRDDKVVAIDANPASGNLANRIDQPSTGTWRTLNADPNLAAYSDFRHHLGKDASSGLEVLASDRGDQVLTGDDVVKAWRRLSRQYPIGVVDCGNQLRDDVAAAVLREANAIVVVSTTRLDSAFGARDTLNWLYEHGYQHLVRSAVMVISDIHKVTQTKAGRNLHEQFQRAVRAVHDVPYDPHLSDAAEVNFDRLNALTRRRLIEAAASLVDGFAAASDHQHADLGQQGWPQGGRG